MRVLISNNAIDGRTGSELYTYELAVRLRRLGHLPVVYSQTPGQLATELDQLGIPVLSDLGALQQPPDIIHGHHHLETMSACLAFPNVPAIYVCHGWLPWNELPPTFPTIMAYIGIGAVTLERIVTTVRLDGRPAVIIPNFYDDEVIFPRQVISDTPRTAVIYNSNLTAENPLTQAVLEACNTRGIGVSMFGTAFGNGTSSAGTTLGRFDLAFAVGRSALEAMTTDCAVIVCDASGVAGMAVAGQLDGPGSVLNLSSRSPHRITSHEIGVEIDRYAPDLIRAAGDEVRRTRTLTGAVLQLVALYVDAIQRFGTAQPVSSAQMLADASRYLQSLAPMIKALALRSPRP